jgi:hypothetical protein
MSGIIIACFAGGIVILVVVIVLLLKFDAKAWIARDLKPGDLYSLIEVASGVRPDGLNEGQARRLAARGMVRRYGNGTYRATIKGRIALLVRQAIRQKAQS